MKSLARHVETWLLRFFQLSNNFEKYGSGYINICKVWVVFFYEFFLIYFNFSNVELSIVVFKLQKTKFNENFVFTEDHFKG